MTSNSVSDDELAARWSVTAGRSFVFRSLAEETLVFDQASGDTHLLDSAAALVLQLLQGVGLSAGELAPRLMAELSLPADPELAEHLLGVFHELAERDLIELLPDEKRSAEGLANASPPA